MNAYATNSNIIFKNYPDVLTLTELSQLLNISSKLATRLLKGKEIYSVKIGREYRIAKSSVMAYVGDSRASRKRYVVNVTSNPHTLTLRK